MKILKSQLTKCKTITNTIFRNKQQSDIKWLDDFCGEFHNFSNRLHIYLTNGLRNYNFGSYNEPVDVIFLCLSQVVCCIHHMEKVIRAEEASETILTISRKHFLDRIQFCLEKLGESLPKLPDPDDFLDSTSKSEQYSYIELIDLILDLLIPYNDYNDSIAKGNESLPKLEPIKDSKTIRSYIDVVISCALGFANVALEDDKKALSALCQKLLRECIAFEDECLATDTNCQKFTDSYRKLKAVSLEQALTKLEEFINDALLRLIFTCFYDFNRISTEKLRQTMRNIKAGDDETVLDELIADFDVNIDRTTQIGIFAMEFAADRKSKTCLRSCLASFESLDACLIPALQTSISTDIHAEILEQHYNEEVVNFKNCIQELIDSHELTKCYHDLLIKELKKQEKTYDKHKLEELAKLGEIVYDHFELPVNIKDLNKATPMLELRKKLLEEFILILRECQAILNCADQVSSERVLKRFKILRTKSMNLSEVLKDNDSKMKIKEISNQHDDKMKILNEQNHAEIIFQSIGISPSPCSVLYSGDNFTSARRRRESSGSINLPLVMNDELLRQYENDRGDRLFGKSPEHLKLIEMNRSRNNLRRNISLRTALFKKQKFDNASKIAQYEHYNNLKITDIVEILSSTSPMQEVDYYSDF